MIFRSESRTCALKNVITVLIVKAIIHDTIIKMGKSNVYGFLKDEVTDKSNICVPVSIIKYYYKKEKAKIIFNDCSDLLEFSGNVSPDSYAVVSCKNEKLKECQIQMSDVKAFAAYGESAMVS